MVYENKKGKFPLIKDSFVATRKQRKFSWQFSFSSTMKFFLSQVEGIEASSSASRNLIVCRRMVRGGGFFSSPFNSFRIASCANESLESKHAMKKSSKRLRQRRSAEKSGACEVKFCPRRNRRIFLMTMIVIGREKSSKNRISTGGLR